MGANKMADTIKCVVCGQVNPADQEFCQNCQSRLQALTGPLKGEDAPLHPGQIPTKKVTAELEPLLPQWLRHARQQARQTAEEEAAQEPKTSPAHGPDLLAGLSSQGGDEDEETPEWLTNITGLPSKKKKTESEDVHTKWVELGHDEPSQSAAPQTRDSQERLEPSWAAPQETPPARDDLGDWFNQAASLDQGTAPVQPPPGPSQPAADEGVGWFRNLETDASALQQPTPEEQAPVLRDEAPEWLKNLDAGRPAEPVPTVQPSVPPVDSPDWLKNLDNSSASGVQPPASTQANVPDWLKSFGDSSAGSGAPPSADATPDWLKTAASSGEEPPALQSQPGFEQAPAQGATPDWLSSLKPVEPEPSAPAFTAQDAVPGPASASAAFTEDATSGNDVDAIFASMQMPDWLSDVAPSNRALTEENLPPAAQQKEEDIRPAELPSWVQAMRPVESAMPDSSARPADAALETLGPLAGLQGVLPAVPGAVGASSRPKSHSIKLIASEEQQSHAALLEQILAAETAPVPMKAGSVLTTQRTLRWVITGLLGFVLSGVLFAGTQVFPLPNEAPIETNAAMDVTDVLPEGAPVLVVFDYEPSTVGELEATGASLMDHLLLLKHPRLALISTSPTGPALAERFMSVTLADRGYQRDLQYVDLGYLPGGLAGVHDFAVDPVSAIPLGAGAVPAWQSVVMQGVTRLSDFAAIIVLTDSAEGGRVWIEQAGLARGSAALVMVSSAQAGPMLLPYVDSGQVNGLIAGINGAAGAEQRNSGLPGFVRRYWDAYSVGLLLAAAMMLLGGLWNFVAGLQNRGAPEAK
jgi:hypothetical protein